MGRKTSNPVGKLYFNYNEELNESTCNIKGCHRPTLKGRHSNNLETHIRTSHANEYKVLMEMKNSKTKINKRPLDDSTVALPLKKRGPMDDIVIVQKKNINIVMDKSTLLNACTELVTINGRPLSIFNDSGLKKILNPLTEAIGGGFTINAHNIRTHILSASASIISNIKTDITNQLISLKIDCVKRHSRSIMGINVQYIKNAKICLYTLAMVEINEQHTAVNLKILLLEVLKTFDLKKEQIYTITCDNAANMVKLARIINQEEEMSMINENRGGSECDSDDNGILNENEEESDIYENEGPPLSCIDIENELFGEQSMNDDMNTNVEHLEKDVFNALSPMEITSCVRCSVHTLQLCILEGFKAAPIANSITRARHVVKKLRTPKYSCWLTREHFKLAILDNETRWNSLYNMLFRLLELKEFCTKYDETNMELKLENSEWDCIENIVDALKPVKIATLALQKEEISLGDFYGIRWKASNGLKSNGSILSKSILKSMEERQKLLLKNNVYLAAIFLDPRYQCLLIECEVNTAINHLVLTWKALLQLNKSDDDEIDDSINNSSLANNNADNDIEDEFELFLSSQSSVSTTHSDTDNVKNITLLLNNYKNVKREPYVTNIIKYWESEKYEKPELYKLACIVHAVPATQVSVERSFSGLKFILSDLRTSLSADLLNAIMIIRSNAKFNKCE